MPFWLQGAPAALTSTPASWAVMPTSECEELGGGALAATDQLRHPSWCQEGLAAKAQASTGDGVSLQGATPESQCCVLGSWAHQLERMKIRTRGSTVRGPCVENDKWLRMAPGLSPQPSTCAQAHWHRVPRSPSPKAPSPEVAPSAQGGRGRSPPPSSSPSPPGSPQSARVGESNLHPNLRGPWFPQLKETGGLGSGQERRSEVTWRAEM